MFAIGPAQFITSFGGSSEDEAREVKELNKEKRKAQKVTYSQSGFQKYINNYKQLMKYVRRSAKKRNGRSKEKKKKEKDCEPKGADKVVILLNDIEKEVVILEVVHVIMLEVVDLEAMIEGNGVVEVEVEAADLAVETENDIDRDRETGEKGIIAELDGGGKLDREPDPEVKTVHVSYLETSKNEHLQVHPARVAHQVPRIPPILMIQ